MPGTYHLVHLCLFFATLACSSDAARTPVVDRHPARDRSGIAIINARVVDVARGTIRSESAVLIRGSQIVALGGRELAPGARLIDARGMFVIPGLWDMHAHPWLTADVFFPQFILDLQIANGVTAIRDMFGPLAAAEQWQKGIRSGSVRGPRLLLAGPMIDGPGSAWATAGANTVRDEKEARDAVKDLSRRGVDFINVYERLPRAAYLAILDEARLRGLPVVGHVPAGVTALEASARGQRCIEHLANVAIACSRSPEALQEQWSAALLKPDSAELSRALLLAEVRALQDFDEARCRDVAQRFAKNGTWHDPTLVTLASAYLADLPALRRQSETYVPQEIRVTWKREKNDLWRLLRDDELAMAKQVFPKFFRIVRLFQEHGVGLLAGSDWPVPFVVPGFSLHDELEMLVTAGLTPAEALRTATLNPATFAGLAGESGTVDPGKLADLVILAANPLEDIRNTAKITGVIVRGEYYDRAAIDRLLNQVRAAATMAPRHRPANAPAMRLR